MRVKIKAQIDSKNTVKIVKAEVEKPSQAELNRVIGEMRQQFGHFVVMDWTFADDLEGAHDFTVNYNGIEEGFDDIMQAAAFQYNAWRDEVGR